MPSFKGYQEFIQRKGSRANQKYVIKTGNSGKKIRVYQNGETALATQPTGPNPYKSPLNPTNKRKKPPMGLGGRVNFK